MINLDKLIGMVKAFVLAFLLCVGITLLHSCKTTKKVVDNKESIDITVVHNDSTSKDSIGTIVEKIYTDINEYLEGNTITEYFSAPDSLGNQYVTQRVTTTFKSNKESSTTQIDSATNKVSSTTQSSYNGEIKAEKSKTTTKESKPPSVLSIWWYIISISLGFTLVLLFIYKFTRK